MKGEPSRCIRLAGQDPEKHGLWSGFSRLMYTSFPMYPGRKLLAFIFLAFPFAKAAVQVRIWKAIAFIEGIQGAMPFMSVKKPLRCMQQHYTTSRRFCPSENW